ncbi:MAG: hypothetical protein AB8G05_09060 [Oligoflexales bacterium]
MAVNEAAKSIKVYMQKADRLLRSGALEQDIKKPIQAIMGILTVKKIRQRKSGA